MNILQVLSNNGYGGIQKVSLQINNICEKNKITSSSYHYINSEFRGKNKISRWFFFLRKAYKEKKKGHDIYICHSMVSAVVFGLVLAPNIYVYIHGPINNLKSKIIGLAAFLLSKKIIFVSKEQMKFLPKKFHGKVHIINNYPSSDFYDNKPKLSNFTSSINKVHDINLCCYGRYSDQKNQLYLLDVIKEIKEGRGRNVSLTLIGSGRNYKKKLVSSCRHKNLSFQFIDEKTSLSAKADVYFISEITGISEDLKNFDFMLYPSKYEGFPLAIIELLSIDVKVISTSCDTGPKEILHSIKKSDHNAAGFYLLDIEASHYEWADLIISNYNTPCKTSHIINALYSEEIFTKKLRSLLNPCT